MTDSKSTNKGGRPRKDGAPARPRVKDPKTGKWVRYEVARFKGIVPATESPAKTEMVSDPADLLRDNKTDVGLGQGHDAAARAIQDGSAPSSGAPVADLPRINYEQVVQISNMIIARKNPAWAMLPDEEKQIGAALDAVIEKYWPELKNAGVEFALALAVIAYVARVLMTPNMSAPERVAPLSPAPPPAPPPPQTPKTGDGDYDHFAHGQG